MRLGLVGYGLGGRVFHAPFLEAAEGIEIAGVVARAEATRARVAEDLPGVPVYPDLAAMLAAGVDAVTITTPPATRYDLVLEAIAAGVHVVADKPFAPSAAVARELTDAAAGAGVVLSVFHNRLFDADLLTLAGVLDSGALGPLRRVHSRFDLDEADGLEAGPEGGLLRDIGTHLVYQLMGLLGPVESVHARLDSIDRPEGPTDAAFLLMLRHRSGVTSTAESTKTVHLAHRSLRAYGEHGSYEVDSRDVQAQAALRGEHPADDPDGWGYDAPENWGTLHTAAGHERVPSVQGAYQRFYEQFAAACAGERDPPSPGEEGVAVLAVLDAARRSAASGQFELVEPA